MGGGGQIKDGRMSRRRRRVERERERERGEKRKGRKNLCVCARRAWRSLDCQQQRCLRLLNALLMLRHVCCSK